LLLVVGLTIEMVIGNTRVICPDCKQVNKDVCYCYKCDKCFSENLYAHDDGDERYDHECLDCGNFSQ
jgi:hypothetical protein